MTGMICDMMSNQAQIIQFRRVNKSLLLAEISETIAPRRSISSAPDVLRL